MEVVLHSQENSLLNHWWEDRQKSVNSMDLVLRLNECSLGAHSFVISVGSEFLQEEIGSGNELLMPNVNLLEGLYLLKLLYGQGFSIPLRHIPRLVRLLEYYRIAFPECSIKINNDTCPLPELPTSIQADYMKHLEKMQKGRRKDQAQEQARIQLQETGQVPDTESKSSTQSQKITSNSSAHIHSPLRVTQSQAQESTQDAATKPKIQGQGLGQDSQTSQYVQTNPQVQAHSQNTSRAHTHTQKESEDELQHNFQSLSLNQKQAVDLQAISQNKNVQNQSEAHTQGISQTSFNNQEASKTQWQNTSEAKALYEEKGGEQLGDAMQTPSNNQEKSDQQLEEINQNILQNQKKCEAHCQDVSQAQQYMHNQSDAHLQDSSSTRSSFNEKLHKQNINQSQLHNQTNGEAKLPNNIQHWNNVREKAELLAQFIENQQRCHETLRTQNEIQNSSHSESQNQINVKPQTWVMPHEENIVQAQNQSQRGSNMQDRYNYNQAQIQTQEGRQNPPSTQGRSFNQHPIYMNATGRTDIPRTRVTSNDMVGYRPGGALPLTEMRLQNPGVVVRPSGLVEFPVHPQNLSQSFDSHVILPYGPANAHTLESQNNMRHILTQNQRKMQIPTFGQGHDVPQTPGFVQSQGVPQSVMQAPGLIQSQGVRQPNTQMSGSAQSLMNALLQNPQISTTHRDFVQNQAENPNQIYEQSEALTQNQAQSHVQTGHQSQLQGQIQNANKVLGQNEPRGHFQIYHQFQMQSQIQIETHVQYQRQNDLIQEHRINTASNGRSNIPTPCYPVQNQMVPMNHLLADPSLMEQRISLPHHSQNSDQNNHRYYSR